MRTIPKKVFLRYVAQADEADIHGHAYVSASLTNQIHKYAEVGAIRTDDSDYTYSKEELVEDIKECLWDAATRIFDYYEEVPDGRDIQDIIDFESESFVSYIENMIHKDIGPNEPEVPGEEALEEEEVQEEMMPGQNMTNYTYDEDEFGEDLEDEDEESEEEAENDIENEEAEEDEDEDVVEEEEPEDEEEAE